MSVNIIGIFDPNSPLIMGAAISTTSTITILAAAATNGQANDAPLLTLRDYYDADAGAGVTSTAWDLTLLHDMTAAGAAPASSGIFKINSVAVLTLTQTNGTPSATFPGIVTLGNAQALNAANAADGNYFTIGARDSDTDTIVEVARVVGATVPYLSIGTAQNLKLYNDGTADFSLGGGTVAQMLFRGDTWTDVAVRAYRESSADHGILSIEGARGSYAIPAALDSGDLYATLNSRGYGTAFHNGAYIGFLATEDWTATAHGCSINFYTIDNTTETKDLRLSIGHDGISTFSQNINLASTKVLTVDSVQVVGARVVDARCDDAISSGDATTDGVIDALRDAMIAHGLIAAA